MDSNDQVKKPEPELIDRVCPDCGVKHQHTHWDRCGPCREYEAVNKTFSPVGTIRGYGR